MIPRDEESVESAPLAERLRARIRRDGPLRFRDWMEAALYDHSAGYYQRRDAVRWGRAGDYRTSPERSPLFAATFARYFASLYKELNEPNELTIIEAGAGAGDFAAGLLRTLERDHPQLFSSLNYLIDERGDAPHTSSAAKLSSFGGRVCPVRLADVRVAFDACVVFSNELLDAMPVHRIVQRGGKFLESYVGLDDAGEFAWVEREPSTPRLAEHFRRAGLTLAEGQAAEVNLEAEEWVARAARAVARGYVVTVDYGTECAELYNAPHRRAGTLRAFRRHALADSVLADPGEQDITTTIDWTQIREAGERAGLRTLHFEPLPKFLVRAGALAQLEREMSFARDEAERTQLSVGAREMILPGGMAESFQVLVQEKS